MMKDLHSLSMMMLQPFQVIVDVGFLSISKPMIDISSSASPSGMKQTWALRARTGAGAGARDITGTSTTG